MTDTVTIPRAEYEALRAAAEELGDIGAYDAAKRALAAGEDEAIPAAYADRLMGGECPVTVFRELRGLSKSALAAASGVNRIQILDIESGRKQGSVTTLAKLAQSLGVTIDDLVP